MESSVTTNRGPTAEEICRDMILRLSAVDPEDRREVGHIVLRALKEAIAGAKERAAKIAEQQVEHYEPGVSAIDVRLSFTRRAKWKDGAAIAAAIRNLPP